MRLDVIDLAMRRSRDLRGQAAKSIVEGQPRMDEPRRLLTVEQFAERTQIGRTTAYAYVSTGAVESVKVGRLRRIPVEAVEQFIAHLRAGTAV
jgi:excisionase family DNA binding protein